MQESASLHELAVLALDSADSGWSPRDGPKPELAQFAVDLLVSKADMLADYFSLQISKVGLLSVSLSYSDCFPWVFPVVECLQRWMLNKAEWYGCR